MTNLNYSERISAILISNSDDLFNFCGPNQTSMREQFKG